MIRRRVMKVAELLREVIAEVICFKMKNPQLPSFVTVTRVELSNDIQHAKIFISVIGNNDVKNKAISVLESAKGFISVTASKQMDLRIFPELRFVLDEALDTQIHIEGLIQKVREERKDRDEQQ